MKEKNIKKQHSAQALSTDDLENVAGGEGKISMLPGMQTFSSSEALYLTRSQQQWLLQNNYDITIAYNDSPGTRKGRSGSVYYNGRHVRPSDVKNLLNSHNIR